MSISDDIVFKNIYYAYRNGYRNNLIVWNGSYICPNGSYNSGNLTRMDLVTLDSECFYALNNSAAHGHACNFRVVERCPRDYPANDMANIACERYALKVRSNIHYKNEHCSLCNGEKPKYCGLPDPNLAIGLRDGVLISLPHFDSLFDLLKIGSRKPIVHPYNGKRTNQNIPECSESYILKDGNCTYINMTPSAVPQLFENKNISRHIVTIHLQLFEKMLDSVPLSINLQDVFSDLSEINESIPRPYFRNEPSVMNPCGNGSPHLLAS